MSAPGSSGLGPEGPRICCVGELMWDFHAASGEALEQSASFRRLPGGAAANVARALQASGVGSAVAGIVADDAFGHGLKAALDAEGLDVSALRVQPGRTGLVFIEGGERFLSYRPHFSGEPRLGLPRSWGRRLAPTTILHVAALDPDWLQPESVLDLARRARRRGARLSVDVNARPRAWRRRRGLPRAFRRLLGLVDVVKASEEDVRVLGSSGAAASDAAAIRDAWGIAGTLLLTRAGATTRLAGPWGTLARKPPRVGEGPALGAGDAFCAGLLAALLEEGDLGDRAVWERSLRSAHAQARAWLGG